MKWVQGLDAIFKNNYEIDPFLGWQYFGTPRGALYRYPGEYSNCILLCTRVWLCASSVNRRSTALRHIVISIYVNTAGLLRINVHNSFGFSSHHYAAYLATRKPLKFWIMCISWDSIYHVKYGVTGSIVEGYCRRNGIQFIYIVYEYAIPFP